MTGNTINFNGSGAQSIPGTTTNFIYNNLTLSNSGTKTASGPLTVASTLIVGMQTHLMEGKCAYGEREYDKLRAHYRLRIRAIILTGGTAAHGISGTGGYQNVTLNDAMGATLTGKATIHGTLNCTSGLLTVSSDSDTVSISSTGTIVRASGHIVGNVQIYIPTGGSSRIYPIGTAAQYLPVIVNLRMLELPGISLLHGNRINSIPLSLIVAMIDSTQDINAYWKVGNSGVVLAGPYTLTLTFDPRVNASAVFRRPNLISSANGGAV